MARTGLEDINALPDPLLSWAFDLIIPNIPGGGDTRQLKVRCKTASIPGQQNELITVALHGVEVNYAGRSIVTKTMPVTFLETRDLVTRDSLLNWAKFARNQRQNTGNFKVNYAVEAQMVLYDDTGATIRTIRLYNCWITSLDDTSMAGDNNAAVEMNAQLVFDSHEDV